MTNLGSKLKGTRCELGVALMQEIDSLKWLFGP